MLYIHAIKGTLIAMIPITLIIVFVPEPARVSGVETTLTVSTFIFAILAGFYLSRSNNRYDNMREVTAAEDALWLSFYHTSIIYGKSFQSKIREILDQYYIISVEVELGKNYLLTEKYFEEIFSLVTSIKYKQDGKKENIIDDMVVMLLEIEKNRNAASVISKEKMGVGQWMIMIVLSLVIFGTLFFFKVSEPFSMITTILFACSLVLVLLVTRDLQSFRLGGKLTLFESAQEVLESLGKMRYYSDNNIPELHTIPDYVREY